MKKIIILQHSGGRLTDQLWRFASIYAYCLERNYKCYNYSFFEYSHYFDIPVGNFFINFIFFNFFFRIDFLIKKFIKKNLLRKIYNFYVSYIKKNKQVIDVGTNVEKNGIYLLPPSGITNGVLNEFEHNNKTKIYFSGSVFQNPVGLQKYHQEIIKYFRPREKYVKKINEFVADLKKTKKFLVGLHIRQGDFKEWEDGKYYYTQQEIRRIIDDFLKSNSNSREVLFVICSDEKIDEKVFNGIDYVSGIGGVIEDLYTLAAMDVIIGSYSNFSTWASFCGRVPYLRFSREKIDWNEFQICKAR